MLEKVAYFDNAAATRMDERVLEAMTPFLFDTYAVATSQFGYSMGVDARDALEKSRTTIAHFLGASSEEFIFTSGGTESSNLAVKGVALALGERTGRHVIVSQIEDFPVLHSARALEREGYRVTRARVDETGDRQPH